MSTIFLQRKYVLMASQFDLRMSLRGDACAKDSTWVDSFVSLWLIAPPNCWEAPSGLDTAELIAFEHFCLCKFRWCRLVKFLPQLSHLKPIFCHAWSYGVYWDWIWWRTQLNTLCTCTLIKCYCFPNRVNVCSSSSRKKNKFTIYKLIITIRTDNQKTRLPRD